jgi:hypothetical protein
VTTRNIRDYEALFYGNGESAKYAALKAFADAGVDALDLLDLVGSGGGGGGTPTDVVVREAVPAGEEAATADYELVADDVGKLVAVFTSAELPMVVAVPDGLGQVASRIEVVATQPALFVASGDAEFLVPGGANSESRDVYSLVTLTKLAESGGESDDQWLISGDLAAAV